MHQLILRLSPLFFFLLIFSCAKDHDLNSIEPLGEEIQAKEDGEGKPCDDPCLPPDYFNVDEVKACSAIIDWGYEAKTCGTFILRVKNLSAGTWSFYDLTSSPFLLTDLLPCTSYSIEIAHVTERCESLPLVIPIQTDCTACTDCEVDCKDPDFVFVDEISLTGARVNFGFNTEICGYFVATLKNNATGAYTSIHPATNPLALTDLEPCTEYTIGISHVTSYCTREATEVTFKTDCPSHCESSSLDPACIYNQYVAFTNDHHPGVWTGDPTLGYVDATNQVLDILPGVVPNFVSSGNCFCDNLSGTAYMKLWIDFDQNSIFSSSELMYNYSYVLNGVPNATTFSCSDFAMPDFTVPNVLACNLRARYVISLDPNAGPCGTFANGQVVDFLVNTRICD